MPQPRSSNLRLAAPASFSSVYAEALGWVLLLRDDRAWREAVAPVAALYSADERGAVVSAWMLGGQDAAARLMTDLRGVLVPFRYARLAKGSGSSRGIIVGEHMHKFYADGVWRRLADPELARRCVLESQRDDLYVPAFEMRIDPP